ncbi:hypothetical protein [Deferrisoma camini]|uniref:hypothetical protein n=1 Tax=Deferrisoma camini TaxID=1035120 RepID=UPI00046D7E61|nr:hypothetical protein [Deferrisoma camini]
MDPAASPTRIRDRLGLLAAVFVLLWNAPLLRAAFRWGPVAAVAYLFGVWAAFVLLAAWAAAGRGSRSRGGGADV